jgi:hypothetical protein
LGKGVVQSPSFPDVDLLDSSAQLGHGERSKRIEHPANRRLVSKLFPPPGSGQCRIWSQARVDLLEGGAVRQNTDHHVEQFLVWRMADGLATKRDVLPQGREEITVVQDVAQGGQGSILRGPLHG